MGVNIFDCNPQDFCTAEARRKKFAIDIGWIMKDDGKGEYQTLAPCLYKDYTGEYDRDKISAVKF